MVHPADEKPEKLVRLLLTQEQRVYPDDAMLDLRSATSASGLWSSTRDAGTRSWMMLCEGAAIMIRAAGQPLTPNRRQRQILAAMSLATTAAFLSYAITIKNGIDNGPYEGVDLAHAVVEVHQSKFGPSALAGNRVKVMNATDRQAFAVAPEVAVPQSEPKAPYVEDPIVAALREAGVMTYEDAAEWFTANGLSGQAMQIALHQHGLYFDEEVGEYRVVANPEDSNESAPTMDALRALVEGLADILYVPAPQVGAMIDGPLRAHMRKTVDCTLGGTRHCAEERIAFVGPDEAAIVVSFDSREGGRIRLDEDVTNVGEIGNLARVLAASFSSDGAPSAKASKDVELASNL